MLPPFLSDFTSQFPLSVLSWHFMILILMDVFQCEMTQPGVNVDHPLPPTAAIWWAGGKQGPSEETWESLCVDNVPPLSNWGKANMIRSNLKDDQCFSPQRLLIVVHVLLRELLRGRAAQFDNSIKLPFQLKDMAAKHRLFSLRPVPKPTTI